jgi:hypothetical protein
MTDQAVINEIFKKANRLHMEAERFLQDATRTRVEGGPEEASKKQVRRALVKESEAAQLLKDYMEIQPARAEVHLNAATISYALGDVPRALEYIRVGLEGDPPAEIRGRLEKLRQRYQFILVHGQQEAKMAGGN